MTEELQVLNVSGTGLRRPDLVCYVNGLPLAVIEAKRPDSGNPNKNMVDEGISQQIRNQKNDEIPRLFAYSQLLLAITLFGAGWLAWDLQTGISMLVYGMFVRLMYVMHITWAVNSASGPIVRWSKRISMPTWSVYRDSSTYATSPSTN